MKKNLVFVCVVCILLFLCSSCQKEADYVLHVGEWLSITLVRDRSQCHYWEWEDTDKTDVVSMVRNCMCDDVVPDTTVVVVDTNYILGELRPYENYCFYAEKKGFVMVNMVYAKGNPDFQRTIHFSIRVVD